MFKLLIILSLTLPTALLAAESDMVILNGKVFTVDSSKQYAEALAIKDAGIIAVGDNKEIEKLVTPSTIVVNADNRLILPGFNDAHLHFLGGGVYLLDLNLNGCTSVAEIQSRLAASIQQHEKGAWITGRGWDHTLFNNGAWPGKDMLDAVSANNPVFVRRIDGHIGWANSLALKKAGIDATTPDPDGGEILRDPGSGAPTGILKESALELVARVIPEKPKEQKRRALRLALGEAARLGVTSIQDNSDIEVFKLYKDLLDKEQLTVRVSEWLDFEMARDPKALMQTIKSLQKFTAPNFIRIGLLKGFVDGTLGSRTAWFFEPYSDKQTTAGLPRYSAKELQKLVDAADSLGLQIGLHCIGAKANLAAINAYDSTSSKDAGKDLRHRLEHAQVLRLQDIPLLAKYDIIASMQPTHCTSDLRWAEKRIGHERCKGAYAWRRILDSGGRLAFGTDWPVEPLDPMRGIYSAVTRKNIESGGPDGGWFPDQSLSVEEAIHCYTMGSAYAEFQENIKGSLTPGKLADIIILSRDILTIDPEEILTTRVDMTIFNGKIIYQRDE